MTHRPLLQIDDATGTVYTYEQFDGHVSRVTAGLRQLGLCPGDTVGFHSDVSIDLFFGFYGTIFAGGCVVFAKANLRKSKWIASADFFESVKK